MQSSIVLRRILRDSIRMYFAPLTGAIKGIRAEWRQADLEAAQHRQEEAESNRRHVRTD